MNHRRQLAETAPLSWQPGATPPKAWPTWHETIAVDLGADPEGRAFDLIAEAMLHGNYYPPDTVRFDGAFREEMRPLRAGDRVLQFAPLFGPIGFWSGVEMTTANRTDRECEIGYVTTTYHHGRGEWRASLRRSEEILTLTICGTVRPQSWLFWTFLPVARAMQKRAWRRGIALQKLRVRSAA